jgi:hypothetical protein
VARLLVERGAAVRNGTPSLGDTIPLDAATGIDTGRQALIGWLRERGARPSTTR